MMKWWTAAGILLFILFMVTWGMVWYRHSDNLIQIAKERLDHLATTVSNQDKGAQISYDNVEGEGFLFAHTLVITGLEIDVKGEDGVYTLKTDRVELTLLDGAQPGYNVAIPEQVTAIKESGGEKKEWKLTLTSPPILEVYALSDEDATLASYRLKFTRRINLAVESGDEKHNFVYTPNMEKDPHRIALPSVVSYYVFDAFRVWQSH